MNERHQVHIQKKKNPEETVNKENIENLKIDVIIIL